MEQIVLHTPAASWKEALPIGNGHMGAMVYGSFPKERIELTENTFYSGTTGMGMRKETPAAFYQMREEAKAGEYKKVHQTAEAFIGLRENYGTNLPVGNLAVCADIAEENLIYKRVLDLETGLVSAVCGREEKQNFQAIGKTQMWASHPDNILVYEMQTEEAFPIRISYENYTQDGSIRYEKEEILFSEYAYEQMHCTDKCGSRLDGVIKVITDGLSEQDGAAIQISGARHIVLYIGMTTDFKRKGTEALYRHVNVCASTELAVLQKRHRKDFSSQMNRCTLSMSGEEEETKLIPLMFQYGRYLLLSSSREDSALPAHLQGIWNDNVACRIGWTCDMHLDINTQMNYWPAESTNLSESTLPLFRWIKESLAVNGREAAKAYYGLEGWSAELVSNAWGYAAPYWASPIAPCPTGGVWILTHMWEHYLYTEDTAFLEQELFPLLEEAVRFFTAYVFEQEDGKVSCGPSISPENSFQSQEGVYQISNGCTYEILMIRELFAIYQEAAEKVTKHKKALLKKAITLRKKLLTYRITQDGCIAEWNHDLPAADKQHRHTSHLLGLFPFAQITPEETPELAAAAEKTIDNRLCPEKNWEDTGWARSMLMLYEARLHHGERCHYHITSMLRYLRGSNYLIMHPPTRGAGSFDSVYELDGNTGLTSCIAEMLLQSHNGRIQILPALPQAWQNGKVSGLKARGGIEISIEWQKGRLKEVFLQAETEHMVCLVYGSFTKEIQLRKEKIYLIKSNELYS